ncbi:MAG: hypothetical protein FIB08_03725 [Candidatus Methanoperedens sp.]|nr:hypothetical protein [Candidatus Methanoperedens sp.]
MTTTKRFWINTGIPDDSEWTERNTGTPEDPEWDEARKEVVKEFRSIISIGDNEHLVIKDEMTEEGAKDILNKLKEIYEKHGLSDFSDFVTATAQPYCPKCERNVRFSDYFCRDCGAKIIHDEQIS